MPCRTVPGGSRETAAGGGTARPGRVDLRRGGSSGDHDPPGGTLRHLPTHTSGIADDAEGWEPVREQQGGPGTGRRQNIYSHPPVGSPGGRAHPTARDLLRFLAAVRGGELLGPELTEAFRTPQVTHREQNGLTVRYGFGLVFAARSDGPVGSYFKDGVNTGASARWCATTPAGA